MKPIHALAIAALLPLQARGEVKIQQAEGWFESAYVTWTAQAPNYEVYVAPAGTEQYTQLDAELIREYHGYVRADALGLKAGEYQFKVVASGNGQTESQVTDPITVTAHDRSGFAHVGRPQGIGAYQNDGTLREGAKVIYVWANNAKTVSTQVKTGSKDSNVTTAVGLQDIIYNYQKGYDSTPLAIRIIGTIKAADMDSFGSSAEGLQVKGRSEYADMPITIEGVGDDAAIHGFGILCRNSSGCEFRNFAIMYCMDDALSLDTGNSHIWIHNMDFFYGRPGSDSDQAKGDGTVDLKGKSHHITVSYNHFYDNGKSSLGGMKSETTDCWQTYHHNWFDHSDSRHPRIRTMFFHIYNNYFDGNSKYGVGVTMGGSALVERNYFRNCKYPMLISKQGTDAEGSGTFSREAGGVIKAYDNTIINARKVQYYQPGQTDGKWDAVLVNDLQEEVTATAYSGATGYNNEADQATRTQYIEQKVQSPEQALASITGSLGAGRMGHGDFHWTFLNAAQDENYAVITPLTQAVQNYRSTLIGFYGGAAISNGGATEPVNGGDGVGISPEANNAYVPSWAGGGGGAADVSSEAAIIGPDGDYFWFNEANSDQVNAYLNSGIIILDADSRFQPGATIADYSDKVGSLQLAKATGMATFYNAKGITQLEFYLVRTGSMKGSILGSDDGEVFTELQEYSGSKGVKELKVITTGYKYLRITNTATGSLHIQGIRMYQPEEEGGDSGEDNAIGQVRGDDLSSGHARDLLGRPVGSTHGFHVVGGRVVIRR